MSLLPVDDAKARILEGVDPTTMQSVDLNKAAGRVLGVDLAANRSQPPFDASAMDGYAVIASDVEQTPTTLKLIGESAAGHGFAGSIQPGQCTRIFTGAPVPDGADTIIIQENVKRDGDNITIVQSVAKGAFVRPIGLDFKQGQTVLTAGTKLNARNIGLCASMNCARVEVRRKPTVAILATGDELVEPGQATRPDQIVSSNSVALAAAVTSFGGEPIQLGIVPDDLEQIQVAIKNAADADVLVTIGGASVGDHDLIGPAFERLGIELDFWKIAMRPGKPLMFARQGKQRVLGLPGNPVSALVCSRIFLKPLIDAMLGTLALNEIAYAPCGDAIRENDKRQDYLRAKLLPNDDGQLVLVSSNKQDSSMQMTLAQSDVLIIRLPFAKPAQKGELLPYLTIDF